MSEWDKGFCAGIGSALVGITINHSLIAAFLIFLLALLISCRKAPEPPP